MSLFSNPRSLTPQQETIIPLGDYELRVPLVSVAFKRWSDDPVGDNSGGKPLVDFLGSPVFAEQAILLMAEGDGWSARWIETDGRPEMTPAILRGWKPGTIVDQVPEHSDNRSLETLLAEIASRNGNKYGGCWDVLAWKGKRTLFMESKQKKRDKIRKSQIRWLLAGLEAGLSLESFAVVEWDFK